MSYVFDYVMLHYNFIDKLYLFTVQTSPEGLYRFEGPGFATVQELIMHQYHSGLPVTSRSGAILKTPIAREDWELNNDDVQLVDKVCILTWILCKNSRKSQSSQYKNGLKFILLFILDGITIEQLFL